MKSLFHSSIYYLFLCKGGNIMDADGSSGATKVPICNMIPGNFMKKPHSFSMTISR